MRIRKTGVRIQKKSGGWCIYYVDSTRCPKLMFRAAFKSKDKAKVFARDLKARVTR